MGAVRVSPVFDPQADVVLFEGDCIDLLATIPDEFARLVVTSPPYNLGKSYEKRIHIDEYLEQQRQVIEQCVRVLHPAGSLCWQVGNYVDDGQIVPLDILLYPIFASLKLSLRNRIVWHFEHGLHNTKRFSGRYEVIMWLTKSDQYTFNLDAVRVPRSTPPRSTSKAHARESSPATLSARIRQTSGRFQTSRPITLRRQSILASSRWSW